MRMQRMGADLHEYVVVDAGRRAGGGDGDDSCFITLEDLPDIMKRHADSSIRGAKSMRKAGGEPVACILTCREHTVCVGLCGDGSYAFFDSSPSVLKVGLDSDGVLREISANRGLPLDAGRSAAPTEPSEHLCDATVLCRTRTR